MFGRIQDTSKLDKFYIDICSHIDLWLTEHTLSEYDKLFITKNKHPIIGLHSTTPRSLESILENGFNTKHSEAVIFGEMPNWSEVKFASPYVKGDKIHGSRYHNQYISYTNGIQRNIRPIFEFFGAHGINLNKLAEKYPNRLVEFPIIIAAFKNTSDKKINVGDWIECWDPNEQVIILGIINVQLTFDEIVDMYLSKKYDVYVLKNNLNYEIVWSDNIKQNYKIVDCTDFK